MRYRLRTLLILVAILPPLLWIGWTKYAAWKAEQERRWALKQITDGLTIQFMITEQVDSGTVLVDLTGEPPNFPPDPPSDKATRP